MFSLLIGSTFAGVTKALLVDIDVNNKENPQRRKSSDIRPGDLGTLDWAPDHARQSLQETYAYVVTAATQAITWYLTARRSKRQWAQRLRVGAIIMVATAGVLPVLSQILSVNGTATIQPAWASVALAIAVTLVALDRFFGFSSAWSRYMGTGQAISAALNQFQFDWQKIQAACENPTGNLASEDIAKFLELAKRLAEQTDDLVQAETLQWVSEFRETLTNIEQSTHHQSRSLQNER